MVMVSVKKTVIVARLSVSVNEKRTFHETHETVSIKH